MKTKSILFLIFALILSACNQPAAESTPQNEPNQAGQSAVQDDESQKNIVQTAVASPQHKTLVAALQAASYVDALSNAGPFTVFAPSDEAFGKLPDGTVEDLVKPENQDKLRDILEYHVYIGTIRENMIRDGMSLNQVNGQNVKLGKNGDKLSVNEANIVATVAASNGIIYVVDQVLLPPAK